MPARLCPCLQLRRCIAPTNCIHTLNLAWPMFSQEDTSLTRLTWLHGNRLELPAKRRTLKPLFQSNITVSTRLLARTLKWNHSTRKPQAPSDSRRNSSRGALSNFFSKSRAHPPMTCCAAAPTRNLNLHLLNKHTSVNNRLFHVLCHLGESVHPCWI